MAFSFDIYPHFPSDILCIHLWWMEYEQKLYFYKGLLFVYRVTMKIALTMFSINCFVKNQSSPQIDVPNQISWGMYHHSGGSVKQRGSQIFIYFADNCKYQKVTWSLTRYLNLSIFSVDHPSCSIIGEFKCIVFHPLICLRIPLGGNSTDDMECL